MKVTIDNMFKASNQTFQQQNIAFINWISCGG